MKDLPGWSGNPTIVTDRPALSDFLDRFYGLPQIQEYYKTKGA